MKNFEVIVAYACPTQDMSQVTVQVDSKPHKPVAPKVIQKPVEAVEESDKSFDNLLKQISELSTDIEVPESEELFKQATPEALTPKAMPSRKVKKVKRKIARKVRKPEKARQPIVPIDIKLLQLGKSLCQMYREKVEKATNIPRHSMSVSNYLPKINGWVVTKSFDKKFVALVGKEDIKVISSSGLFDRGKKYLLLKASEDGTCVLKKGEEVHIAFRV